METKSKETKITNRKKSKKPIATLEIYLLMTSIIAFSMFISQIGIASAAPAQVGGADTGCCLETLDGAICQDVNKLDSGLCKSGLIGTSCNQVSQCQIGCCYNSNEGLCSLNSPKEKCELGGGNWSSDSSCDIPQCELGCCILGDQSSLATSKQCTQLSTQYGFTKNFQVLDQYGSCIDYQGLYEKGACVTPSDIPDENICAFTTKEQCTGEFNPNKLCTSKSLDTICKKTQETTCVEDKDQVYFKDSCGNTANVYDASKFNDDSYWENIIQPISSCSPESKDCGNCDYLSGSVCAEYKVGMKEQKSTYGDFVCRDLDCENGRKHGESWCVSDIKNSGEGNDPIGSRYFKASCVEGEISIEGCADFNQEICIESS